MEKTGSFIPISSIGNLYTIHRYIFAAYGLSGAAKRMSAVRTCSLPTASPGLRLRGLMPGRGNPSIPRGGRNPGMPGGCVTADMAEPLRYGWLLKDPGAKIEGGGMWGWVWLWGREYGCGWRWGGGYPIRRAIGGWAASRARSARSRSS